MARLVLVLLLLLPAAVATAQDETGTESSPAAAWSGPVPGRVIGDLNVRSAPTVRADTLLRTLQHNDAVLVQETVQGEDGDAWYRIGDGEYVHAADVRVPGPAPRAYDRPWIDVDLGTPALITAYEDGRAVYAALVLFGKSADDTPPGEYHIVRRVEDETMDSTTLGVDHDAEGGYYLENVLYTQYFTDDGSAIHFNYWSDGWGYPGTHGCLGLNEADALWFWNWAQVGVPLYIHHGDQS